jgi:hypothetical protein
MVVRGRRGDLKEGELGRHGADLARLIQRSRRSIECHATGRFDRNGALFKRPSPVRPAHEPLFTSGSLKREGRPLLQKIRRAGGGSH